MFLLNGCSMNTHFSVLSKTFLFSDLHFLSNSIRSLKPLPPPSLPFSSSSSFSDRHGKARAFILWATGCCFFLIKLFFHRLKLNGCFNLCVCVCVFESSWIELNIIKFLFSKKMNWFVYNRGFCLSIQFRF